MKQVTSVLEAVTVYREGALCRRLAKVEAQAERQVALGGLPLSLEPGSLRAYLVEGDGRVVDVRAQFDVQQDAEADVPASQRAVEEARRTLAVLELRHTRLEQELNELTGLFPEYLEPKRGEPPRPAHVDAIISLSDFREAELATRLEERRALNEKIAEAQRELALREARVREASTAQRRERTKLWRVALVTLAQPPEGPLSLALEYRVPGARWVPNYALQLSRDLTQGTLKLRASVVQQTGEDWAGVQLSLSTANAQRSALMPELKSLKLGRAQEPPPRSGWREPPPGLDALFEAYDANPPPRPPVKAAREDGKVLAKPLPKPMPQQAPIPAPPPPPAPSMVSASMAPVGAAMPMSAAPLAARRMEAPMAKSRSVFGGGAPGSAPRDTGEFAMMDEAEEAPMAEGASYDEPMPEPEAGLGDRFNDYARLVMPPPGPASASRGRLTAAGAEFAAFVGVSVEFNFVALIISEAASKADAVWNLTLPSLTQPVTAINSFDYRYDCAARVDVPSTGRWVSVPVTDCAVKLMPEYVCVPSVEPKVYRTLQVENGGPLALLPGPVDVTAGDEFLMTTTLPAIAPGSQQPARLGLGVEEGIKVSRKTQFKETTGGLLGGTTVLPHEVDIELNNRLGAPARIEVRERVPVPDGSEKDLKVEEAEVTPPWEKVETPIDGAVVKGARRWKLTVPPGEKVSLHASFAIRLPGDKMIDGGNRRS